MSTLTIYDCDGTLIDSERLVAEVCIAEIHGLGLTHWTMDRYFASFVGMPGHVGWSKVEDDLGAPLPEGLNARVDARLEHLFATRLTAIDGVRDARFDDRRRALRRIELGAAVPHPEHPHRRAARPLRRRDLFRLAGAPRQARPRRLPVRGVADGHDPKDCIVIEDSVPGVTAARRAGMRVIGFTGVAHDQAIMEGLLKEAGALGVAASMAELPALVRMARDVIDSGKPPVNMTAMARRFSIRIGLCGLVAAAFAADPARAQSVQVASPIAYLLDVGTNGMLYEKKADEPHPPGSVLKLLTAETVFKALKDGEITPEQEFPITEQVLAARRRAGGVGRDVRAAEQPRLGGQPAAGLIVQSANDAALALADGIAKSEAAFVQRMQERAKAIGLTRFEARNATGYAHPEQRVSARDAAKLTLHLIATYPERFPLFSQREFTWNFIRQTNRNPLIAMNIGADGMMGGMVQDGGFNLVGTAQQEGRRLVVVVFGADSAQTRAADARRLLDWASAISRSASCSKGACRWRI